jgi:hypothetical protein
VQEIKDSLVEILPPRKLLPTSARAYAKLTNWRLKRGVFRSVAELQVAIDRFIEETNADPRPCVDRTSKPHPRRRQTWEANVRVTPLAPHPRRHL